MASGKQVENKEAQELEVKPFDLFYDYLQERASLTTFDRDSMTEDRVNRILSATTEDELEQAMEYGGLVPLKSFDDGAHITINSWQVISGTNDAFKNRFGVWALMDLTVDGEHIMGNTGVESVIAFLRLVESGQLEGLSFPVTRRLKKIATTNGEALTLLRIKNS
jgi:hypothetical protein